MQKNNMYLLKKNSRQFFRFKSIKGLNFEGFVKG